MSRKASVLVVDDDASLRQTMAFIVETAGLRAYSVETGKEALEVCKREAIDVVLLDVQLPDINGLQVLAQLRERQPDIGVIIVSVVKEIAVAVEAMKLGAMDYLTKDFSPTELSAHLTKTLQLLQSSRELLWLREEQAERNTRPMILGRSEASAAVKAMADKVAGTQVTVLLTGESGTGKEVLARYLHSHSDRNGRPFVAINLPAIPSELVESTLFGHEKGAFTGAARQLFGKFELASGGTLFLDEVSSLKLDVQAKLLRVLQEREIERVGGTHPIPLDVRIICATNRDLPTMVAKGEFREDLYWRIKVVPIQLPPLRERLEDIPALADYFLARFCLTYGRAPRTLAESALAVLRRYTWPGNIRELENLMERMVVVCDATRIEANDLPLDLSAAAVMADDEALRPEATFVEARAAFERNYLWKALEQNGWKRKPAAMQLGMATSTLKRKMKDYGLFSPDGSDDD
jgi:two-component system, NtrC family, response regulator AtoC